MRSSSSSLRSSTVTTSVDAAALQTEMAKKYGITMPAAPKQKRIRKRDEEEAMTTCSSCGNKSATKEMQEYCSKCGYFPERRADEATINSLAVRRGLVMPPKPKMETMKPLNWYLIESSIIRKLDPDSCCPICMEAFRSTEEVLLSCGHIFHKVCLRSFENFIKSGDLTCPICRTRNYQKKVTTLGSVGYERCCARCIQRTWRGYIARKAFRLQLREFYKHGLGKEDRRRRFHEQEMDRVTKRLDHDLAARQTQVDGLLQTMDQTLLGSRQLDLLFEEMLANRQANAAVVQAVLEGQTQGQPPSGSSSILSAILLPPSAQPSSALRLFAPSEFCLETSTAWTVIHQQAVSRGASDCAICMLPVSAQVVIEQQLQQQTAAMAVALGQPRKRCLLLSCSHVFHQSCLGNFERFARVEQTCPVCRCRYQKRLL